MHIVSVVWWSLPLRLGSDLYSLLWSGALIAAEPLLDVTEETM
jgi:hypothetical protein